MPTFKQEVPVVAAAAGHLPPQSIAGAATGQPGAGGWVAGSALKGRSLLAKCQTGALVGVASCAFKLRVANDANGTGAADVADGALVTIVAANTQAEGSYDTVKLDPTKFYAIACLAGAGTSALVGATLSLLDATYNK